ncbi:MAG: hypothetical protein QXN32_04410 [Candidatus Nitrosocaldus sp.]
MTIFGDMNENRRYVRMLLGNPPEGEVSNDDIDRALESACSSVKTDTTRVDWNSNDRQWHDVIYAQNIRAAYNIMQFYASDLIQSKAKLLLEEYYRRIRSINRGQEDSTPTSFTIVTSEYRSRKLREEHAGVSSTDREEA